MNAPSLGRALLAAVAICTTLPAPSPAADPAGPAAARTGVAPVPTPRAEGPPQLHHTAQVGATTEPQRWRGEFVYFADAASFTDCASGRRWPVAMAGDYLAAERAYTQQRSAAQAPLVIAFEGRVEMRADMEGPAREHMTIARFGAAEPGARCTGPTAASRQNSAALKDTDWQLLEIDARPAPPAPAPGGAVRLRLASEASRVSGFTGCNLLIGAFELAGPALRFTQLGGTRMACIGPAMELEAQMFQVLGSVTGWRIERRQLQLLDGTRVRARFVAAPA